MSEEMSSEERFWVEQLSELLDIDMFYELCGLKTPQRLIDQCAEIDEILRRLE